MNTISAYSLDETTGVYSYRLVDDDGKMTEIETPMAPDELCGCLDITFALTEE